MDDLRIAFVGGGNMAFAIATGLLQGARQPAALTIAEPREEQRELLRRRLPQARVVEDNTEAAAEADVIVLAVKPQVMRGVCRALGAIVRSSEILYVSIAAGTSIGDIVEWLGGGACVIRAMPNQPALVGRGMTVLAAAAASDSQRKAADSILSAVGDTLWLADESMMDGATAISGSGPAYFYLLMEMMIDAAKGFGFSPDDARQLVVRTAQGASHVAATQAESIAELRARVTSPGGTTAAAIDKLAEYDIRAIFHAALTAARDRGRALAESAGADRGDSNE